MSIFNIFKPKFTIVGERGEKGWWIKLIARNGEIVMHGETLTRGDSMRRIAGKITAQTGWPFVDKSRASA